MRSLNKNEIEKLESLKIFKRFITISLFFCLVIMIILEVLDSYFPYWSFYIAFFIAIFEAATIGGIADWYAVHVLFRHPMNFKIPHTAIVPKNQKEIADNLGSFLETNFLSREQVDNQLRDIDFSGNMARWLSDEQHADNLAGYIKRLVPDLIDTIDQKQLLAFVGEQMTVQVAKMDFAPMASNALDWLTRDRRHQRLLDYILGSMDRFLNDEKTLYTFRERVKDQLPKLVSFFGTHKMIVRRLLLAARKLFDEIKDQPNHPMRREFDNFVRSSIENTRNSKEFNQRIEDMKSYLLTNVDLGDLTEKAWESLQDFVLKDLNKEDSMLEKWLSEVLVDVGKNLADDRRMSDDINKAVIHTISDLVEQNKGTIANYVSDEVRSWDSSQLVKLIEANVGEDLQYIRINGMIVGGIVGFFLHVIVLTIQLLLP